MTPPLLPRSSLSPTPKSLSPLILSLWLNVVCPPPASHGLHVSMTQLPHCKTIAFARSAAAIRQKLELEVATVLAIFQPPPTSSLTNSDIFTLPIPRPFHRYPYYPVKITEFLTHFSMQLLLSGQTRDFHGKSTPNW